MSDTTNTPVAKNTPVKLVSRNGVEAPFIYSEYGKLSPRKGQKFLTADVTVDNIQNTWLPWVGIADVSDILSIALRRLSMDINEEATDEETGVFDEERWLQLIQSLEAGTQTKGELEDQIEALQTKVSDMIQGNGEFASMSNDEILTQARAINVDKLTPLKKKLSVIEARGQARAAKRAANTAAKEAAAKAAAVSAPQQQAVAA